MPLFESSFADAESLSRDWIAAPGMTASGGVLTFAPDAHRGVCVARTREAGFRDFILTADVRIVRFAVAVVVRAIGPDQYYMIQFDLANDPSVVWFHTFTPTATNKYRLGRIPSAHVPREGEWHRMRVVANGPRFDVFLGDIGGPLLPCASWTDALNTFDEGAVGVWQHGGEAGQYRAFHVEALTEADVEGVR
jgi:hypothetical protein